MRQDNPYALHPIQALRSLRALLNDPEDTSKVFEVIRAMSGKSFIRGYRRFAATATGQTILAEKRQLIDTLRDRDTLRNAPAGTLARAYAHFLDSENLSADGLIEASRADTQITDEAVALYGMRIRDMHDLWHVTTGYGRDTMGEDCLLGFTYAQTGNPAIALIALAGARKIAGQTDRRIYKALWQGYRAGKRAAWLPAADWEQLLMQPLEEVRKTLGILAPETYQALAEDYLGAPA